MDWKIIESYFAIDGITKLTEHQVESYNDFIQTKIPLIVASTPPVMVWKDGNKYKLSFDNITYLKPRIRKLTGRVLPMFPIDARTKNYTYESQINCDVHFEITMKNDETFKKVFQGFPIGKIPVMIGSCLCLLKDYPLTSEETNECPYDPLGYFIINGNERIILCQEKVADNCIMGFHNTKSTKNYTHLVEIKSLHESFTFPPKKLEIYISKKFNGLGYPILINVPRFKPDIPLVVFIRALGIETDFEITAMFDFDDLLIASLKECADLNVWTRHDAITYLENHIQYTNQNEDKYSYVLSLLNTELLPHVKLSGESTTQQVIEKRKLIVLHDMVSKLLKMFQKKVGPDDRDAYQNKRIVSPGSLLTHLFRQLFQKFCKDIRSKFSQEINNPTNKTSEIDILNITNLYKILKVSTIENKLKQALATGNFVLQGVGISTISNATKTGVSQILNRLSYLATVSHVRRIQTPIEKSGKLLAPRKLHGSSWGYVCPVETPEGHSIGIMKTITPLTIITQHIPAISVLEFLPRTFEYSTIVYVNGAPVGSTSDPVNLYNTLKAAKKVNTIHIHSTVVWNVHTNKIMIETDGGRMVRPLLRIQNQKVVTPDFSSWDSIVKTGLEYISPLETEYSKIAMFPHEIGKFDTLCEIHPSTILGHMASSIPLSDHNQSPRNTYQSAMGKQAVGIYARNYTARLDKNSYILCSPQRPFVETRMMNILKQYEMPSGENLIVAIGMYSGYNQEDSVILNQSAVDRGMFRTLYGTIYKDSEHKHIDIEKNEQFMKPPRIQSYVKENGMPKLNSTVNSGDILIGKVIGVGQKSISTVYSGEQCRVDHIWEGKDGDGYPYAKIRVITERSPEIGDKVASVHAQKGTVGIILSEEDMPYTASGMKPDLILNPHAIPSRMTIAQLMETMFGKIGAELGCFGDGTPYSHLKFGELQKVMTGLGMHPQGNEVMYNGQTGQMMDAEIFIGPTYYQRLKHMVVDKKHSRATGPIVSLTRQPCEGRAHDGGLRVGEMERDCLISHGASRFVKERLMDVSDPFETGFCRNCGVLATVNANADIYNCGVCESSTHFEIKTIPYAVKLWTQELESMHVIPRLVFE